MFNGARAFNQPLENWDTKELKTATDMFNGCKAMTFQNNVVKVQKNDI